MLLLQKMINHWKANLRKYYPFPTPLFLKGCLVFLVCGMMFSALNFIFPIEHVWLFKSICIARNIIISYNALSFVAMFWLVTHEDLLVYADCMADTFLYGFLRNLIPKPEEKDKESIIERHIIYKNTEGLTETFPFDKLFIIIPKSGYIPTTLAELDPLRIELRQDGYPILMNRAGVRRQYKFSIYKIKYRNNRSKHITVAMTGATPLITLKDTCKENAKLKTHLVELTYLFYNKLLSKLNQHKELKDSCELLYIDTDNQNLADYFIQRHLELLE